MKTRIIDGITYVVVECINCHQELLFKQQNETRRVHGMCKKCNKDFVVVIEGKK